MANAFYFILKGLFVLKMFKFLFMFKVFGHVGKAASLTSKFMTSQPG